MSFPDETPTNPDAPSAKRRAKILTLKSSASLAMLLETASKTNATVKRIADKRASERPPK